MSILPKTLSLGIVNLIVVFISSAALADRAVASEKTAELIPVSIQGITYQAEILDQGFVRFSSNTGTVVVGHGKKGQVVLFGTTANGLRWDAGYTIPATALAQAEPFTDRSRFDAKNDSVDIVEFPGESKSVGTKCSISAALDLASAAAGVVAGCGGPQASAACVAAMLNYLRASHHWNSECSGD